MTQTFIMIIALILTGYLMKRLNYIKEAEGGVIAKLIFNLTLPSLVIVTLSSVKIEPSLMLLPVIMVIYIVIAKLIVIILFLKYNNQIRGSVGMMAAAFNIGLFAYPFNVYFIYRISKKEDIMDLNQQLLELKEEYMRIQNDLEKVESTGQSSPRLEEKLIEIEQQIAQVRAQL